MKQIQNLKLHLSEKKIEEIKLLKKGSRFRSVWSESLGFGSSVSLRGNQINQS